jgi:hypothetical protein
MRQASKYGPNGEYLEPVIVHPNENGEYILPDNCTFEKIPEPNVSPVFNKLLNRWIETAPIEVVLAPAKQAKIKELNDACENTILGRFSVNLDDTIYEFSYDEQAQSRFNGTASLFNSNLITEVGWTSYLNGARVRITLNKEKFNKVAMAALIHCNTNIEIFNQLLEEINLATSHEELDSLSWLFKK